MEYQQHQSAPSSLHTEPLEQPVPLQTHTQRSTPDGAQPDYAAIIVQHTTELIALIDAAGLYRFVTPAFAQIGYADTDLLGRPYADFLHPDDAAQTLSDGLPLPAEAIVRFRSGDGSWRRIACRTQSIVHQGEPFNLVVGRDITAESAPDDQRSQEQRSHVISALTTGMIHDLNNMLTIIAGSAAIVAETLPPGHPAQADLATISAVTAHAGSLTNQVLNYVHDHRNEARLIQIDRLLHDTRILIERLIGPLFELTLDAPDHLWPVMGVPGELTQAVLGLIANTRNALPHGGELVIRARNLLPAETLAGSAAVSIEISAAGFDTRAAARPASATPGAGAQPQRHRTDPFLVRCRQVLQAHGGLLQRVETVGGGATLRIVLPRA